MNIFSEIYGQYYKIVNDILSDKKSDEKKIRAKIEKDGFGESLFFIPNKLIPDKNNYSPWGLLKRTEGSVFSSKLVNDPENPLTLIEKKWLKAILNDPKTGLFLTGEESDELKEELKDITPLFDLTSFKYFDRFSDGDNYTDEKYIRNFQTVLAGLKKNKPLYIDYTSVKNNTSIKDVFYPLKLEYSEKNDKIRLICRIIRNNSLSVKYIINISTINEVMISDTVLSDDIKHRQSDDAELCEEPLKIRVTNKRNGIERFMVEFASYKKKSTYDPEKNECTVSLWYDPKDKTELLIMLLGFGPVLEIMGPDDFRKLAAERIEKQYRLFEHTSFPVS